MKNENVIKTVNITKRVKRKVLLEDISLNVEAGSICGFLGPNGAGKTTLMRVMMGLVKPSQGSVFLNGVDVNGNRPEALKHVGAMIESPLFYDYLTGRIMLLNLSRLHGYTKEEREEKVEEVLQIVGLEKRGEDKIHTYSLGMKQRLGIAQALLGDPSLILLDEPANGLDPIGMRELRELIISLNQEKGITFFISSHLLDELQHICNHYILIREGRILYQGQVDDLMKDKEMRLEDLFVEMMTS
ncbi:MULTISPECIES: ABC transporter ATP-binding protein [Pontibacillus]|uniref:ATP-binding cassette domain-containing protein n=1 Tax=Pontibacillus chungwhensis TaxID=265426 RepID=A0ABY8UTQ5_9BACI|nr:MULTISPECIES: ATP-binding cassette domain-containing protein [Pontibacillus]MCD5323317.1 ATP-binding cassette domain-containing protein [Pontibacillus sp. HN14]WIF96698.1 ATP-binding cassette domain-containing protein [Pontibacillus chungwhensis]